MLCDEPTSGGHRNDVTCFQVMLRDVLHQLIAEQAPIGFSLAGGSHWGVVENAAILRLLGVLA